MAKLEEISKPIQKNLDEFAEYMDTLLESEVELVDKILKYLSTSKGKQIRPILVMLTSLMFGEIKQNTYVAAAMLELFHNATLIHDDVVDEATQRRGKPTVNNIWSNQTAVLFGDFFLAKGMIAAIEAEEFEFLKATSHAIKMMSEGELLQIQKTNEIDRDEETYFRVIRGKTASLISTCCKLGALAGGASKEEIAALYDFGDKLGMAFQIKDDILDYVGNPDLTGKILGNDLVEKKLTLPLLYALRQTSEDIANDYLHKIKEVGLSQEDINEIINFVIDKGGIDYAQKVAEDFTNDAIYILKRFPDSDAKTSLIEIANFFVQRDK